MEAYGQTGLPMNALGPQTSMPRMDLSRGTSSGTEDSSEICRTLSLIGLSEEGDALFARRGTSGSLDFASEATHSDSESNVTPFAAGRPRCHWQSPSSESPGVEAVPLVPARGRNWHISVNGRPPSQLVPADSPASMALSDESGAHAPANTRSRMLTRAQLPRPEDEEFQVVTSRAGGRFATTVGSGSTSCASSQMSTPTASSWALSSQFGFSPPPASFADVLAPQSVH